MLKKSNRPATKLTRFELEVMGELWKLGRASVRELLEALPNRKQPAYTTVQTIVRRLEEKNAVRQVRKVGNAHIYEPMVSKQVAYRRLIDDFLEVFGGSPAPLMAHLVESGRLSLEDLKDAERLIDEDLDPASADPENETLETETPETEN
ncbi:MAG: BlaI/MecI/CopY family transcriptional regulator [Acidobacteriota bacterium]